MNMTLMEERLRTYSDQVLVNLLNNVVVNKKFKASVPES